MKIFHNSQMEIYRKPVGAVACCKTIIFRIEAQDADEVRLRLWYDDMEHIYLMNKVGDNFELEISMPTQPKVVWYYFVIHHNNVQIYYGNNLENLGGEGLVYEHEPPAFQVTVYDVDFETPDWLKNAVIYQIFPDRFYNGNEDNAILAPSKDYVIHQTWNEEVFYNKDENGHLLNTDIYGGNILGIIKKLDYLANLGVTALYLTPIFEAWSNHKYNTADYEKIDPLFGDEQIFCKLCDEARKRNINIILDGVFNHTGSDSKYFNKYGRYRTCGAFQDENSPYRHWYNFSDEYNCGYKAWWGVHSLPSVNETDASYQDYIIGSNSSIIKKWLRCGAKGWRLDVADELPPAFIRDLRKAVKSIDPDAAIIGEVWEDATNKISYGEFREYLLGYELDSVMNYPFKNAIIGFLMDLIPAEKLSKIINSIIENYPLPALYTMMNILGSHDVERIKTLFGEAELDLSIDEKIHYRLPAEKAALAKKRVVLASAWQMTFIGTPCIYYGDEVGLEGHRDPFNRRPFPWNDSDLDLYDWYKSLVNLRKSRAELRTGKYAVLIADADIYAYIRHNASSKTIILINRSKDKSQYVEIDLSIYCIKEVKDFQQDSIFELTNGILRIQISQLTCRIFTTI